MLAKKLKPLVPQFNNGHAFIRLTNHKVAMVDSELYPQLNKYFWRAAKSNSCWYAVRREVRNGRTFTVRMHRQVAKTPPGIVCHHENFNSLDNRRSNLSNLDPLEHSYLHGYRQIRGDPPDKV